MVSREQSDPTGALTTVSCKTAAIRNSGRSDQKYAALAMLPPTAGTHLTAVNADMPRKWKGWNAVLCPRNLLMKELFNDLLFYTITETATNDSNQK